VNIIENACPGPGACGGMYTANTMSTAIEALGLSLPHSSSSPAVSRAKEDETQKAAKAIKILLEKDLKPKDIVTKKSFENAIISVMVLGGSTNAVLHLIAMARAFDVPLGLEDFQRISEKTPLLADFKPSGKYRMESLHKIGGMPAVLKYLLKLGMIHGDSMTVTGKTLAENLQSEADLDFTAQDIIREKHAPIQAFGHIMILHGTLAPEGIGNLC